MIYDGFEKISSIKWSVYGKIKEVNNSDPLKKSLKFDYDAMGNRIAKHVYAGSAWMSSTYYVRDAQGNVMGTYEHKDICTNCPSSTPIFAMSYKLLERDVYGSSRCAIDQHTLELLASYSNQVYERIVGSKTFEMSNHLGNVISVVSDRKIPIEDASNVGNIKHYIPQILTATDYYAFGEAMEGRVFNSDKYRYSFNGQEKDDEVKGGGNSYDYGARIYDPRLGKWLSVDPFATNYVSFSPYCFVGNSPIIAVDPDGKRIVVVVGDKEYRIGAFNFFKPKEVRQAYAALKYLNSGEVKAQVNRIGELKADKKNIVRIHVGEFNNSSSTGSHHDQKTGKTYHDLNWNPDAETFLTTYDENNTKLTRGVSYSPAMGLYHELAHKYHKIFGKKSYDGRTYDERKKMPIDPNDKYEGPEEEVTIKEVNKVAKALGEPQAENHSGEEVEIGKGVKHFTGQKEADKINEEIEKDFKENLKKTVKKK
ncbi:MAG: RHS repeat-associated core domain-containing protein [Sphingobacteriaceae bacterium]|nr:RHS repeat-associated core domain-containing protein [Sphingobacteriaceae bacterium]